MIRTKKCKCAKHWKIILINQIWFYFAFPIESRRPKINKQIDNCCLKWLKTNWLLLNFLFSAARNISLWCLEHPPATHIHTHTHALVEHVYYEASLARNISGHLERLKWFECARISLYNHICCILNGILISPRAFIKLMKGERKKALLLC